MRHAFRALVAVAVLVAAGCGEREPRSPTETVQAFLEAMERSSVDHEALARAYDLLASGAQGALRERAAKAHALGGRKLEPWQMLVQGRFRLRFQPTAMTERVEGKAAVVTVVGAGVGERADVPLIREGQGWRLDLRIGESPAAQARAGASPTGGGF